MKLKDKITSGLVWSYAERMSAQLITLGISIMLARLIAPEKFGIIAIVLVFINIANIFAIGGLGNALIQKKSADYLDFSTVFYFSIGFSLLFYFVVYFSAPFIASFYEMPDLTWVLRIMALRIPLGGINSVQYAYVSREMKFKKFFISTVLGSILSGAIAIYLAHYGYGVWALVIQYLIKVLTDTIVLWFLIDWKPHWRFSFSRLKGLFSFGWKLLTAELLTVGYNDIRSLVIGKAYSPVDLAFYNRGQQFPRILVANINSSISKVLFPAIAANQDDKAIVKQITRRSTKTAIFILSPLLIGLALVAKPLTIIVLTEKWIESVPYLQILAVYYLFMPIHTISSQAITAIGRSDMHLMLQTIKILIGLTALIIAIIYFESPVVIALGALCATIINTCIHIFINKKMFLYRYTEQIKDILTPVLLTLICFMPSYFLSYYNLSYAILLLLQVLLGSMLYVGFAWILQYESLLYIIGFVKPITKKRDR